MTLAQCIEALETIAKVLGWEKETIDDFHLYAQQFGGTPGGNVYEFALKDALRMRGVTVEQLRNSRDKMLG